MLDLGETEVKTAARGLNRVAQIELFSRQTTLYCKAKSEEVCMVLHKSSPNWPVPCESFQCEIVPDRGKICPKKPEIFELELSFRLPKKPSGLY